VFADLKLENLLFIDIETVPAAPSFAELPEVYQEFWAHKTEKLTRGAETPAEYFRQAGIYAEFGKIICISVGVLKQKGVGYAFRLKSFCNNDERQLLLDFSELLNTKFAEKRHCLCGHNIREFDIPYLCRRMLIHDLCLPRLVDCQGMKPWEIPHLDTMQLWKFGDQKTFTSLALLATLFGIPSPKNDISGADVARVYYEEHDLERISRYCQQDVLTVAQLVLRFRSLPLIADGDVTYA
jgi:DNA polymerase elongation subunit (family B)